MPTRQQHIKKYEENKLLLGTKLSVENAEFYNWIVTVAFYAALHLVEARLADDNIDSSDHTARNNNVERFNYFQPIRAKYKVLYDRSRVARYDATFMNEKKARFALSCLETIEHELHNKKPDTP